MPKPLTEQQQALIDSLTRVGQRLAAIRQEESDVMREAHSLVRDGFSIGVSGVKLSKASQLSLPRVYQVREESASAS